MGGSALLVSHWMFWGRVAEVARVVVVEAMDAVDQSRNASMNIEH
jgi:hypothetical protein